MICGILALFVASYLPVAQAVSDDDDEDGLFGFAFGHDFIFNEQQDAAITKALAFCQDTVFLRSLLGLPRFSSRNVFPKVSIP